MANFSVECQPRPEGTKANALRRGGQIPATVYGHNGGESVQVLIPAKQAEFLVRDAEPRKSKIDVSVPDLKITATGVLQEVQVHPWKRHIYHLSFFVQK
jgi:large subunit ribosomal protein L25